MMIIDEAFAVKALLVSTAFLLAAATIAILRVQRFMRTALNAPANASEAAAEKPAADNSVEERIGALQKIAEDLSRKDAALPTTRLHDLPYENAVRMAKNGAGVDDITKGCGLKKGEAELLLRLHTARASAERPRTH